MRRPLLLLLLSLASLASFAFAQTAEEIMSRVAANQDAAEAARARYVYHQSVLLRMKRASGKLAREEIRDLVVTPAPKGFRCDMVHFEGKYYRGKQPVPYSEPGFQFKGTDIDGQLADSLVKDFTQQKESRDGLDNDLFPLTAKSQKSFRFRLTGSETYQNQSVYRIDFEPAPGVDESMLFAGEALIDAKEYQPVLITTHQAFHIPFLVKTALGTDIRRLGFKVTYKKVDDGVWFPATYGGEFEFRIVFFYARKVSIGMVNSDFQRTAVETHIAYGDPADKSAPAAPAVP